MKLLTTLKLTSASRRARRISRAISSISFSPRRPRPRILVKIDSNRSDSASNMRPGSLGGRPAGRPLSFLFRPGCSSLRSGLVGEERLDELLGVELDEVGRRLAHADELHRDPQLRLHGP